MGWVYFFYFFFCLSFAVSQWVVSTHQDLLLLTDASEVFAIESNGSFTVTVRMGRVTLDESLKPLKQMYRIVSRL